MTWDRVIQDSDEEEGELEGDALSDVVPSIDPLDSQFEHKTEQRDVGGRQPSVLAVDINHDTDHDFDSEIPVQEVDVNATEHTHDLLGFGASQLGVNFDAYLQQSEEEGARVRLSSSQRRREERWIPTELGNGSICESKVMLLFLKQPHIRTATSVRCTHARQSDRCDNDGDWNCSGSLVSRGGLDE